MAGREEQLVTLRHPYLDLELLVREPLAKILRRFGYTDVIEPADELPEMSETEEDDDTR